MNDVPENELLSAYLDGELTAAEQANVEQLLESSPAARQLLEELRTLSSTLQSIPQYTLAEDLSEQVLRTAERRILTEGSGTPAPAVPLGRSIFRRLLTPRGLVWSGLAVAVAVMLLLHEPDRPQRPAGDQVAMTPAKPKKAGPLPSIRAAAKPDEERPAAEAEAVVVGKGDRLLLVQCDVSPKAVRKQAFDRLLLANGIAWDKARGDISTVAEKGAAAYARRAEEREQQKEVDAIAGRLEPLADAGQLDVVYVEATPGQIEATLAGLAANSEEFLSVSVEPDPAVESQQAFTQYNRRGVQRKAGAARVTQALQAEAPAAPDAASQQEAGARGRVQGQLGRAQRIRLPYGGSNQLKPKSEPPPTQAGEFKRPEQPAPTCRVLFILRVVGPNLPAAADPMMEKSDPPELDTAPAKE